MGRYTEICGYREEEVAIGRSLLQRAVSKRRVAIGRSLLQLEEEAKVAIGRSTGRGRDREIAPTVGRRGEGRYREVYGKRSRSGDRSYSWKKRRRSRWGGLREEVAIGRSLLQLEEEAKVAMGRYTGRGRDQEIAPTVGRRGEGRYREVYGKSAREESRSGDRSYKERSVSVSGQQEKSRDREIAPTKSGRFPSAVSKRRVAIGRSLLQKKGDGDRALWRWRELPEIQENGHPMDGKPFTPSAEPMRVSTPPVKKTRTEVVAGIFDVLESGEQTTAAIAVAIGRSERSVHRDLTALISDGKVSLVKKGVYRLQRKSSKQAPLFLFA